MGHFLGTTCSTCLSSVNGKDRIIETARKTTFLFVCTDKHRRIRPRKTRHAENWPPQTPEIRPHLFMASIENEGEIH